MLRTECPQCGADLDPMRIARCRPFDRTAWCLGVSAMAFIGLVAASLLAAALFPSPLCW
jgi:hypothetical protein